MSILFNATTSKNEHTTESLDSAQMTFLWWHFALGQGEGPFGRVVVIDEAESQFVVRHQNAANQLYIQYLWDTATKEHSILFTATDNIWNAIGASYDRSSSANSWTVRVNFAAATGVTLFDTGVTAPVTGGAGWCIGNRSNQQRTWDGRIAFFQRFNVVLTAAEIDSALLKPGSIRRGLQNDKPMWHATYLADYVTGLVGTGTSLATADGPPIARRRWAA